MGSNMITILGSIVDIIGGGGPIRPFNKHKNDEDSYELQKV